MDMIALLAEPLALGLSTGTWCAMYCAPVLLPFLLGREGLTQRKNLSLVGLFLAGRLVAYAAVGFALGAAGLLATEFFDPALARRLSSVAYVFCGLALLAGAFGPRFLRSGICAASGGFGDGARPPCVGRSAMRWQWLSLVSLAAKDRATALLSGLAVGLHICPPFWVAAARSAAAGSPASGAAYFLLFYAGTLPFFLPLLGIPVLSRKNAAVRRVARMTQVLVGGYFLACVGLVPLVFRG